MKKLIGRVRLSRGHNSNTGDYVGIEVTDELSSCTVLSLEFASLEDAARVLIHSQEAKVEMEWNDSGVVGKRRENKTEVIEIPEISHAKSGEAKRDQIIADALVPFEVDGWTGNGSDFLNGHRRAAKQPADFPKHQRYTVSFTRFVDVAAS